MHLSIVLNRLLVSINVRALVFIGAEGHFFFFDNDLLLHFSDHNNDLLVLKQWKGALNRISCLCSPAVFKTINSCYILSHYILVLFLRRPWSSGIILYFNDLVCCVTVYFKSCTVF